MKLFRHRRFSTTCSSPNSAPPTNRFAFATFSSSATNWPSSSTNQNNTTKKIILSYFVCIFFFMNKRILFTQQKKKNKTLRFFYYRLIRDDLIESERRVRIHSRVTQKFTHPLTWLVHRFLFSYTYTYFLLFLIDSISNKHSSKGRPFGIKFHKQKMQISKYI